MGSLTGPLISSGNIKTTKNWDKYRNLTLSTESLTGENELFFIFGGDGAIGNIDRLVFGRAQKNVLYAGKAAATHGVNTWRRTAKNVDAGDWLKFEDINLGNGFSEFSVRYRKRDLAKNKLTLHLDSLNGPQIGEIDVLQSKGRRNTATGILDGAEGRHDIYAKFSGPGVISHFDSISLEAQPSSTKLPVADASATVGMSYFDDKKFLKQDDESEHWIRFDNTSVSYNPKIEINYARGSDQPMKVEVRKDQPTGRILGIIDLPNTGSYDDYEIASAYLPNRPAGIYDLVFRFVGYEGVNVGDINLIRIEGNNESVGTNLPLGNVTLDNIVVDQFGYRPEMAKVAIFRDGEIGLGSDDADYIPGTDLTLVDAATNEIVFTGAPEAHLNGIVDPLSGDRAWSFDFSAHQTPGSYYVYDAQNNSRSATFEINENIYDNILREAFRTFLYQRSGFDKTIEFAGENYADSASHTGARQDGAARVFNRQGSGGTARNLRGGWYDAGDFKKYSNWTADYILGLLHAYHANPEAWSDDWNLPDSGNGIPDILDEVRWGVEHLQRMQETSSETGARNVGSVLSVLDSDDDTSPPSENTANSFYGTASTSATFTSAAAYAFAATTFDGLPGEGFQELADSLRGSAISAYRWAENNPNVRFNNAENEVGNGNSEVTDDYMLDAKHRIAAVYLYELTQDARYRTFVEANYTQTNLMTVLFASSHEVEEPNALLHYSTLTGIDAAVGTQIRERFNTVMEQAGNARPALVEDPYRSFIQEYTWGSNKQKSRKGHMFTQLVSYDLGDRSDQENLNAAAGYLHYIHGVNPLGKVYLSNMNPLGADRSVDEMFHKWFADGSQWDNVNSSFGPPPGYLVGGPNQYYNEGDDSGSLEIDQPPMKSYVETNAYRDNEQSWQFTENSNGYQIEYLKLLSQFVD